MKKNGFSGVMILLFILFGSGVMFGQYPRIRYNLAGYEPGIEQRAVIMANTEINSTTPWNIYASGQSTPISTGFVGTSQTGKNIHTPAGFNYEIKFNISQPGEYRLKVGTLPADTFQVKNAPYKQLANEVINALRVRRSGSDASLHPDTHLGDTSITVKNHKDGFGYNHNGWKDAPELGEINMVGGWYDAGDYIKFTTTTAYSVYNLLLAYELNPDAFDGVHINTTPGGLNDLLDEAKWGLQYLLKILPSDDVFIFQVGDSLDHAAWPPRLPQDDKVLRKAYTIKSKPKWRLLLQLFL